MLFTSRIIFLYLFIKEVPRVFVAASVQHGLTDRKGSVFFKNNIIHLKNVFCISLRNQKISPVEIF